MSVAASAAEMLRPIHRIYHAERVAVMRQWTWSLRLRARGYRRARAEGTLWLEDRARYRAVREELGRRGKRVTL